MTRRPYSLNGWSGEPAGVSATELGAKLDFSNARILVVDDQPSNLHALSAVLTAAGYTNHRAIEDPTEVIPVFRDEGADLILLDLHMPRIDGLTLMKDLRGIIPEDSYLPIIVLTADTTTEARQGALSLGAKDFITKPIDPTEVVLRIANLLETRSLHLRLQRQNAHLEDIVQSRTSSLRIAIERVETVQEELRLSQGETVKHLSMAAELRDPATGSHIERMSRYCTLLSERIGIESERCEMIRLASQMHDVGKIGIPDNILLKPGSLEASERQEMQRHADIGRRILSGSRSELMNTAAMIAWTHHERIDGQGYPRGLTGDEIPLEGRVAAIADVFDALTSDRVYRESLAIEPALEIMRGGRGRHFDAELFDEFSAQMPDVLVIHDEHRASIAS